MFLFQPAAQLSHFRANPRAQGTFLSAPVHFFAGEVPWRGPARQAGSIILLRWCTRGSTSFCRHLSGRKLAVNVRTEEPNFPIYTLSPFVITVEVVNEILIPVNGNCI